MNSESVYEKAIEALVLNFKDDGPIYIANEMSISNFFKSLEYGGRKIIFFNNTDEKAELEKNGNLIRLFEIEYPSIIGEILQVKINHMVIYQIDLLKDENDWPKKLSTKEREITREGIAKCKLMQVGDVAAKTYRSSIQNTWTYVTFRFDFDFKEFRIEKIETKTI